MKKIIFAFFPWIFIVFGYTAIAQEDINLNKEKKEQATKNKRESEEIIIRKKGAKDANINIQINGDEIMINGKPLSEYKDDEITVNKRKMILRSDDSKLSIMGNADFSDDFKWNEDEATAVAFLGVSTEKTTEGARIIEEVSKETAAGKAGLEKGDIITKLAGKKIDGPQSLFEAVNEKKPKEEVSISYKRGSKEKTTRAVLGERKPSFSKTYSYNAPNGSYKTFTMPYTFNGDHLKNLEELEGLQNKLQGFNGYNYSLKMDRRQKLGLKIQDTEEGNAVKILEVEDSSAAAAAGLKKDDLIIEIAGEKITNTDEAREQLQENKENSSYNIKARRNGSEMNFTIKIPKKLKTANL